MTNNNPNTFDQAAAIIHESGIVELVRDWRREDGLVPFSFEQIRPVLIAWLGNALDGRPFTERSVAKTVSQMQGAPVSAEDVLALTRQVLDLIDFSPLPGDVARRTKAECEVVLAERGDRAAILQRKRLRFLEFTNAILLCQRDLIPELGGRTYDVALSSVIGTADVTGQSRWRYEVATLVSDNADVRNIAVGIVGANSRTFAHTVGEMAGVFSAPHGPQHRRHALDHLVADTAYGMAAHGPLSELGAKLVVPYPAELEGAVMAVADGAVMVEGRWYRDDLPAKLRDAMKTFRAVTGTNREGTRVADWDVEWGMEERRAALVNARRAFEGEPREAGRASEYVQHYAYGSPGWLELTERGRSSSTEFARTFNGWHPSGATALTGAAAHGFLTTLLVVKANAVSVNKWREYHALDEGNGLIDDEFSRLYAMVVSRVQESMAEWSRTSQAEAVARAENDLGWGAHWAIDLNDDLRWETNESTRIVNGVRANAEAVDTIATALVARLCELADGLLACGGKSYFDLSTVMRIEMRFDFLVDFTMDEENRYLPMPEEGLPLSAEVALVPRHLPRCASPRRSRG